MSGLPVVLCGKSPTLAKSFVAALEARGPQVDVVHVIHDVETGRVELPSLLSGSQIHPSSNLGTNTSSSHTFRTPLAVVVGKGFNEDEILALRNVPGTQKVPWLLPNDAEMTWTRIARVVVTAGTALPGVVGERVVRCLEREGMIGGMSGSEKGKEERSRDGDVYWF